MTTIIIIVGVLFLILIFLLVIKTKHFIKHIRHKKLINWFYFSSYKIILSSTTESAAAKKKQNAFTLGVGIVVLLIGFVIVMEMILVR